MLKCIDLPDGVVSIISAAFSSGAAATPFTLPCTASARGPAHGFASDRFEGDPNGTIAIALPRIARFLEGGL